MCGIAGIAAERAQAHEVAVRVEAMTATERHRGPDDGGVVVVSESPAVVLGHRRLAIIDLSAAGHQPMRDPASGSVIVFNGEIYNFAELREKLKGEGCAFRTQTDTEVILKAIDTWGEAALARLRGIFAFAIWRADRSLLLARDPLGVKPLYLAQRGQELAFASEVRALMRAGFPRRLDPVGLVSYLSYGSVQEPTTLLDGVRSLGPGVVATLREGRLEERKYWELTKALGGRAPAEDGGDVRRCAAEAVRLQLVSDVPVGVFLSGGIDSAAIAALAQRTSSKRVRTISIVFDEAKYDEREGAKEAAEHIGTEHREVRLSGSEVVREIDAALGAFDLPSMDGLNTYFVAKATRAAGLTVALSGVGGDELFGGYNGYARSLMAERAARVSSRLVSARRLSPLRPWLRGFGRPMLARRLLEAVGNPVHPYFAGRRVFDSGQVRALLGHSAVAAAGAWEENLFGEIAAKVAAADPVNRASAFELETYMLSTLLRDTDQMSMAHALEVRVPLIDQRLVELALSIDGRFKVARGRQKPLLTSALRGLIPDACERRPKRGFVLPFDLWLRGGLREVVREVLVHGKAGEVAPLRPAALRRAWGAFDAGHLGWSRIWALFVLLRWIQRHGVGA
jgi:asparagine synthase (glutamine-hydrolysing)